MPANNTGFSAQTRDPVQTLIMMRRGMYSLFYVGANNKRKVVT